MPDLSFQLSGSFLKFMTCKLVGSHCRSSHCSRQAAFILKNCAVAFRLNQVRRKACQVKDTPKAIAAAGEGAPSLGCTQRGIYPTKHYIKIFPKQVWQSDHWKVWTSFHVQDVQRRYSHQIPFHV
jgi:hypothetical protein